MTEATQLLVIDFNCPTAGGSVQTVAVAHLHRAEVGEQVCKAGRGVCQHTRGLAGVKEVGHENAEVSLQPHNVAVRAVQHLHNLLAYSHNLQLTSPAPLTNYQTKRCNA